MRRRTARGWRTTRWTIDRSGSRTGARCWTEPARTRERAPVSAATEYDAAFRNDAGGYFLPADASSPAFGRKRSRAVSKIIRCVRNFGASAIKCWWLPRNPLVCYSLSLISGDAVLSAMRAGLTTRCLTFRHTFVCTPTSLLMAFADTGRRSKHLMAEAPGNPYRGQARYARPRVLLLRCLLRLLCRFGFSHLCLLRRFGLGFPHL